jgi:hypothetical protein
VIAALVVGLAVSILAGYLLADLAYTRAQRPHPHVASVVQGQFTLPPSTGGYRSGPAPPGEPPHPALFTTRPLTTPLMRKMGGLQTVINCGLLTPAEARKVPDLSWIEFQ